MNSEVNEIIYKKKSKGKLVLGLISTLVVMTIVCVAFIVGIYYYRLNRVSIEEDELYQYFNGSKYEYKGKILIKKNNEITSVESKDLDIDKNTYPIYYKNNKNLVIFPIDMEVLVLDNINKTSRINYFTNVEFDGDSAYVIYKDNKKFLGESFLYDGDNLYFFTYPVKVSVDKEEYNLSSGSYMIVNYKDQVEIYNKDEDDYKVIESHNDDVIAELNDIKINLSTDMIITSSGSRLLIKKVGNLPLFE